MENKDKKKLYDKTIKRLKIYLEKEIKKIKKEKGQ
jgi:hypothetical protein